MTYPNEVVPHRGQQAGELPTHMMVLQVMSQSYGGAGVPESEKRPDRAVGTILHTHTQFGELVTDAVGGFPVLVAAGGGPLDQKILNLGDIQPHPRGFPFPAGPQPGVGILTEAAEDGGHLFHVVHKAFDGQIPDGLADPLA